MTILVDHGQLLFDVFNELHALREDLADARGSTSPAPPFDESWLPFGSTSKKGGVHTHVGGDWVFDVLCFGFDVFIFMGCIC